MALESRLELKLTQKLILTPQLQQAIKLLQMPQLELSQSINQELVENPFLEEELEDLQSDQQSAQEKESAEQTDTTTISDDSEQPLGELMSLSAAATAVIWAISIPALSNNLLSNNLPLVKRNFQIICSGSSDCPKLPIF